MPVSEFLLDLDLLPPEGKVLCYKDDLILKKNELTELIENDSNNCIEIKITPIDSFHYQTDFKAELKLKLDCSRCGIEFEKFTSLSVQEFLSRNPKEGEDLGFVIVPEKFWDVSDFIRQTLILETPRPTYKFGEKCLNSCSNYDSLTLDQAPNFDEEDEESPFSELKGLFKPD